MDTVLLLNILIILGIIAVIIWIISLLGRFRVETPEKRAGRLGERLVSSIIGEVLNDDDVLLTNIEISADKKQTELDNVVINENGVFIIEVKNYNGILTGDEDSREWIQTKTTYYNNVYQKQVKNPIKQVKRQIYILSEFLKHYDIDVWIRGYVFFVERNSPIDSSYILETQRDINQTIHRPAHNKISKETQDKIVAILT